MQVNLELGKRASIKIKGYGKELATDTNRFWEDILTDLIMSLVKEEPVTLCITLDNPVREDMLTGVSLLCPNQELGHLNLKTVTGGVLRPSVKQLARLTVLKILPNSKLLVTLESRPTKPKNTYSTVEVGGDTIYVNWSDTGLLSIKNLVPGSVGSVLHLENLADSIHVDGEGPYDLSLLGPIPESFSFIRLEHEEDHLGPLLLRPRDTSKDLLKVTVDLRNLVGTLTVGEDDPMDLTRGTFDWIVKIASLLYTSTTKRYSVDILLGPGTNADDRDLAKLVNQGSLLDSAYESLTDGTVGACLTVLKSAKDNGKLSITLIG